MHETKRRCCKYWRHTLVPLLGPIGGGGLGGATGSGPPGTAVAAGGAAPSSAAFTTSLELLFFEEKSRLVLEAEFVLAGTLGVNANLEAADAMLQLAMF